MRRKVCKGYPCWVIQTENCALVQKCISLIGPSYQVFSHNVLFPQDLGYENSTLAFHKRLTGVIFCAFDGYHSTFLPSTRGKAATRLSTRQRLKIMACLTGEC